MGFAGDARKVGALAAVAAVALGLAYMGLAGAPAQLLLINAAALGMGLAMLMLARSLAPLGQAAFLRASLLVASSGVLVLTTTNGLASEGASRWLSVGGLVIQPGLIFAPVIVTAFAVRCDRWSAAALAIAIVAIAMQPDRAVSAMILAGVAAAAIKKQDLKHFVFTAAAGAGFVATLLQPDALGAVPYVDQILYTSFASGAAAGLAVWVGVALMLVPLLIIQKRESAASVQAFVALWAAAIAAAAIGNYPTPLVGYGASAIIGYLLALMPLARPSAKHAASRARAMGDDREEEDGVQLRFA